MSELLAGRFQLEEVLFEDEEATTWAALDLEAGELVAVTHLAGQPDPERGVQLLDALVRVQHPLLAGVRWGEVRDDGLWFAQQYAPGESLAGPLGEDAVLERLAGVAGALSSLHAAGLWHGAVRPGALVVDAERGEVVVVGQGLLRHLAGLPAGGRAYRHRDEESSPAADVYALAVTAIALLTGVVPPPGEARTACSDLEVRASTRALLLDMLEEEPGARPTAHILPDLLLACSLEPPAERVSANLEAHTGPAWEPDPPAPRSGFTLVQLMIVVAIIGLLAGLVIPLIAEVEDEPAPSPPAEATP